MRTCRSVEPFFPQSTILLSMMRADGIAVKAGEDCKTSVAQLWKNETNFVVAFGYNLFVPVNLSPRIPHTCLSRGRTCLPPSEAGFSHKASRCSQFPLFISIPLENGHLLQFSYASLYQSALDHYPASSYPRSCHHLRRRPSRIVQRQQPDRTLYRLAFSVSLPSRIRAKRKTLT